MIHTFVLHTGKKLDRQFQEDFANALFGSISSLVVVQLRCREGRWCWQRERSIGEVTVKRVVNQDFKDDWAT